MDTSLSFGIPHAVSSVRRVAIAVVNRLTVLAPYIFLIGSLIAALIFIASRRRKS